MAGRRLVDSTKLLGAARSVFRKHVSSRSHQLGVYSQTSEVAKAWQDQYDRLSLTAGAAWNIARRLNESSTQAVTNSNDTIELHRKGDTPFPGNNPSSIHQHVPAEGLEQDHHYDPSEAESIDHAKVDGKLEPRQESPRRHPLPDGTLPPDSSSTALPDISQDTFKDRAQPEIPKKPIVSQHETGGDTLQPVESVNPNLPTLETKRPPPSTSPSPSDAAPDGVDINVFRTTKGSKLLDAHKTEPKHAQELAAPQPSKTTTQHMAEEHSLLQSTRALPQLKPHMRESSVPSSQLGRLWQYGGLATSMAFGAIGESFRRIGKSNESAESGGSLLMSADNMERLVVKLSRMRGAALKLGQMLSFQDMKLLPQPIHEVLQRVQDSADYMPARQRDQVLEHNLGREWRTLFSHFEDHPIAAASIGQVHRAVLASDGRDVAVKIQYPGVANSIDSDLNNLSVLLTASRLLPKGLFLDKTIANARTELAWECDYLREAEAARRFKSLLANDPAFRVPDIVTEASGKTVLTADFMHGTAVTKLKDLSQPERDWIGTQILRLCFREMMEFGFMQTDPNWTNFLFDSVQTEGPGVLQLLDFGASRAFPASFMDPYIRNLEAAARNDRDAVATLSTQLGYLTGHESSRMRSAHVDSVITLAEPFSKGAPDLYDFRDQTVTERVKNQIPLMLRERLSPPPEETYSLHRKLSGAFLLCARLRSQVRCRQLFEDALTKYDQSRPSVDTA